MISLYLVHDLLLSKNGISTHANHPLRLAAERHKARLQAELTRSRLRRRCATLDELKTKLVTDKPAGSNGKESIQWVRINTIQTTLDQQMASTFKTFSESKDITSMHCQSDTEHRVYIDKHIPNLVAISRSVDITKTKAYQEGQIILQDRASCFPAYLLLGSPTNKPIGDILDSCAAPGNKTTHLAMLLEQVGLKRGKILACERDKARTATLEQMIRVARADSLVTVLGNQDFLALDPNDPRFANTTHLLLDPSCSGSGIMGRDDIPSLALPFDPRQTDTEPPKSKKRKRSAPRLLESEPSSEIEVSSTSASSETNRLHKLSNLQSHIVTHALSFPAATTISYSTCSLHAIENEYVVSRILASDVAKRRGWRVMKREEQVSGLREWTQRGQASSHHTLQDWERDGCLRCMPGDGNWTIGFFVCAFVRDEGCVNGGCRQSEASESDEWEGLSDR